MIEKLMAWPAILLGVLWALKPGILRDWLTRKTHRILAWIALATLFFPLMRLGRVLGPAGLLLVFILLWIALSKSYQAIQSVFLRAPLACFQAIGVLNIIGGLWILRFRGL